MIKAKFEVMYVRIVRGELLSPLIKRNNVTVPDVDRYKNLVKKQVKGCTDADIYYKAINTDK